MPSRADGGRPGAERRTLDRLLSRSGVCSRAEAVRLIADGRIAVNGAVARAADRWVDPARDVVTLDGAPLAAAAHRTLLLHKPKDCVTTRSDEKGRRTIYDLLGAAAQGPEGWLAPVGRLDRETTGLLLLTNDHDLAEVITNPDSHLPKTYRVKATTLLDDEQLGLLARGVELDDGRTRRALATRVRDTAHRTILDLVITEGRNRQVRRMLGAVGSGVLELKRTSIGPLSVEGLAMGRHRLATTDELAALRAAVEAPARRAPR